MLSTFSKIKTIDENDSVFHPLTSPKKRHIQGIYYIEKDIVVKYPNNEVKIKAGILNVRVLYDYNDDDINDPPYYYISYLLYADDSTIYTWKIFVDKVNSNIVMNTNEEPVQIITLNSVGNLVYTKAEMLDRFKLKSDTHFDEEGYYITTPKVTEYDTTFSISNGLRQGDNIPKNEITYSLNEYGFGNVFGKYINNSVPIVDLLYINDSYDNYRGTWIQNILKKYTLPFVGSRRVALRVPGTYDHLYSGALSSGIGDYAYMYHGNYMMNKLHFTLGNFTTDWEYQNIYPTSRDVVKMRKIVGNTFVPGYKAIENDNQIRTNIGESYRKTGYFDAGKTRLALDPSDIYLYSSRIIKTPDTDIQHNPIICYSSNHKSKFKFSNVLDGQSVDMIDNDGKSYRGYDRFGFKNPPADVIGRTLRQFLGQDLDTYDGKHTFSPGLIYFVNKNQPTEETLFSNDILYGRNDLNPIDLPYGSIGITNRVLNQIKYRLLHIGYENKLMYIAPSDIIDLDYIKSSEDVLNKDDIVQDIRLGNEIIITVDKSETSIGSENRIFTIQPEDPSMALTYLKMEINKNASRYQTVNKDLAYSPAYATQSDFGTRIDRRLALNKNETLAIDKITAGFRPIQIKINGTWRNVK